MKIFNECHLISFGNYLLSAEREKNIADRNYGDEDTFEKEIFRVNDFDFKNWLKKYFIAEHEEMKAKVKEENFDIFKKLGKYFK